jgi:hypothetical protein
MPKTQKGAGLFSSNTYEPSYIMENGMSTGVLQYFYYFIVFTIVILVFLVAIHYTVYPIFRTRPGGQGIIPLPGSDDSKLFWRADKDIRNLKQEETPLGSTYQNWSMMLDIQVDNPTANTGAPRILFTRGGPIAQLRGPFSEQDTILTLNPSFNVCLYLDKLTNDLCVAVQTSSQAQQSPAIEIIIVPNLPVRKAVRVGIFVGAKVLEVYINGYLVRSKAFIHQLRANVGDLQPPNGTILSTTARVRNLRIFPRPVSPAEFRAYGNAKDFDIKDIPDTCSSN